MTIHPEQKIIEAIRAFVAVALPLAVTGHIRHLVDSLKRQSFPMVRWVRPEGVHLTLKFLGDIRMSQTDAILDSLVEVVYAQRSFHLHLENAGVFPSFKSPRVLWLGVGGNVGLLANLQQCVEEAMAERNFPKEQRPFTAHLTLGRINGRLLPRAQENLVTSLWNLPVNKALDIPVKQVSLVQSTMLESGVLYQCIGQAGLQAGLPD